MKRFLCLSLCLGLMASACKKKYTQDDLDKARAEGKASGKSSATAVTKKDKAAVIKACLPLINNHLKGVYDENQDYFVFRQTTAFTTTAAAPALIISTFTGLDMEFNVTNGIGRTSALVTTNLEAMGKDSDIQAQFVDRDGDNKGKGYRVFISGEGTMTHRDAIAAPAAGAAYAEPDAEAIYKIYDREGNVKAAVTLPAIPDVANAEAANGADGDARAGWYDCVLDTETQDVTLMYSDTALA